MDITTYLGMVGYSIILLGARTRSGFKTHILIIAAYLCNSIFFFGQDMPTSCAVNILTAARMSTALFYPSKRMGYVIIFLTAVFYTYFQSELIAAVACIIGTYGYYWHDRLKTRYFMIFTAALRAINAGVYGLFIPLIAEVLNCSLLIGTLKRLKRRIREQSMNQ